MPCLDFFLWRLCGHSEFFRAVAGMRVAVSLPWISLLTEANFRLERPGAGFDIR